jgi:hypothetical protein
MNTHAISSLAICFASAVVLCAGAAQAQPPDADSASEPPATPAIPLAPQKSAKAPYSIPFQMRPTGIATVLRTDTSFAFYDDPATGGDGSTVASMLLAAYKLTDKLSPLVRLGMVSNSPPQGDGAAGFLNPALGVTYALPLSSDLRLALFFGMALPLGSGGGDSPDPANVASNAAGIRARSAMDNAMFAVNYMTGIVGVGFGYIANKLTVQAEITFLQLFRVKGSDTTAISPDSTRTNSTAGLHAGYFIIPQLSLGGEIRYQRWLARPTLGGMKIDSSDIRMDTVTMAVGPRMHFKVGNIWLRPGIAYARGLDKPLTNGSYNMVQVDIPVVF